MYQTCTEFGFYQTSSLTAEIFGDEFPLAFFTQQCSDIFGPRYIDFESIYLRTLFIVFGLNNRFHTGKGG
jgi:hypothetical protein